MLGKAVLIVSVPGEIVCAEAGELNPNINAVKRKTNREYRRCFINISPDE
jgi:hypothetical protein